MSIEEVISSGLLESYVLGICTDEEAALVNKLCFTHSELNKEIELIESSLICFSTQEGALLNSSVKDKICRKLVFENEITKESPKGIPLKVVRNNIIFYKIGIAASVLLCLISGFYIITLNQKLNQLNSTIAELNTSKSFLANKLTAQEVSMEILSSGFKFVSNPQVKTIALSGMNSMVSKSAIVHWNPETKEVIFNASALPASPSSKQYQLWAIVDGKPVDAGIIVLENGVAFQKMKSIAGAKAFAVTIENIGGSVAPTIDTMCLLGNV